MTALGALQPIHYCLCHSHCLCMCLHSCQQYAQCWAQQLVHMVWMARLTSLAHWIRFATKLLACLIFTYHHYYNYLHYPTSQNSDHFQLQSQPAAMWPAVHLSIIYVFTTHQSTHARHHPAAITTTTTTTIATRVCQSAAEVRPRFRIQMVQEPTMLMCRVVQDCHSQRSCCSPHLIFINLYHAYDACHAFEAGQG